VTGAPFVDFVLGDEGIVVGAVGMWESHSDFQGRWKEMGNLLLVSLAFLGPSFPQPRVFMPAA